MMKSPNFAAGALLALLALNGFKTSFAEEREQIGTAMRKPIYRDQIRADGFTLRNELHRLFMAPSMEKFREAHHDKITPTKKELTFAAEYHTKALQARLRGEYGDQLRKRIDAISESLASDELSAEKRKILETQKLALENARDPQANQAALTASIVLKNWKFQRLLYDKFGGGRILWQQFGIEAFDAMHRFLKQSEAAGDFTITDPSLRADFYEYWTNEKMHGAFLTDDEVRIRTTFLEPPWRSQERSE